VQRRHARFYRQCSHWSFADGEAQPIHWRREHLILIATVALMTVLSAIAIPGWANAMKPAAVKPARVTMALPLPAPAASAVNAPAPPRWHSVTVQPGQTLSDIFQSQGLGFDEVQQALDASKGSGVLHNIHPGDSFAFRLGPNGNLEAMRFDADATHRVTLHFDGAAATRTVAARHVEHRQRVAHGVIHSSLFGAASKAGMSDAMMIKLADVFKYDIDFAREIRAGDSFTVVYDAVYRDGEYLHAGHILAAEFYNRGHRYTAYRYTLPDGKTGYYSEDGRPLQKALLRVPIKFTRISSRFGVRVDPVVHKRQLHAGVDYAAPTGTPIHAAGDGVITIHSWVRGYGRYIRIKNSPSYSTYYGHMSRYASGLHVGSHVHQGEVIGYVGQTGWATGPHLHYGVLLNGKPVNPLTVTLPKPQPLAPKLMAKFAQHTKPLLARIERVDANVRLASNAYPSDGSHAGD
jgi:murein DD-endopeptidase MepM/ murein hydrolase activator NlpD